MLYTDILKKIKNLEIQGAENIAIAAVQALELKLKIIKNPKQLQLIYHELISLRPTEPALRNSLRYCLSNYQKEKNVTNQVIDHFKKSKKLIAEFGAKKIENGMVVMTHCHSGTVTKVIIQAKKNRKKFVVFNTETRPKFQGRITANELAKAGIEVHHFVDSAGRIAMKEADLFLFGADAITTEGRVINKIGTAMLLYFAHKYNVLSYSCTNSWKFDPESVYGIEEEIEQRSPQEIWENPPKGVKIHNPAFEPVSPDLMTGIITELGIFKPETLVSQIKVAYPWMIG